MPNFSSCACYLFADRSTLDGKQHDMIEGYLRLLHKDLPYFENFRATRLTDECIRLFFEGPQSDVKRLWPPVSSFSGVAASETCVFLLTSSGESYTWQDRAATIHVLRSEGDDLASDVPQISQVELASAVKAFAKVLAAPWQAGETPSSYEIDCSAIMAKAKLPQAVKPERNLEEVTPVLPDDLDLTLLDVNDPRIATDHTPEQIRQMELDDAKADLLEDANEIESRRRTLAEHEKGEK
jgi:hypothetical protein